MSDTIATLIGIYERDGKLTTEQVLTEAADPASPLHTAFEWDDQIAGYRYRLIQAGELIRKAEVTIQEMRVRRFVFLPSTDSFHPIEEATKRADWRAELVAEFQRDAARFHERWVNHKHVADQYKQWRAKPI